MVTLNRSFTLTFPSPNYSLQNIVQTHRPIVILPSFHVRNSTLEVWHGEPLGRIDLSYQHTLKLCSISQFGFLCGCFRGREGRRKMQIDTWKRKAETQNVTCVWLTEYGKSIWRSKHVQSFHGICNPLTTRKTCTEHAVVDQRMHFDMAYYKTTVCLGRQWW